MEEVVVSRCRRMAGERSVRVLLIQYQEGRILGPRRVVHCERDGVHRQWRGQQSAAMFGCDVVGRVGEGYALRRHGKAHMATHKADEGGAELGDTGDCRRER